MAFLRTHKDFRYFFLCKSLTKAKIDAYSTQMTQIRRFSQTFNNTCGYPFGSVSSIYYQNGNLEAVLNFSRKFFLA